jgi:hypothetical protein
MKRVPLRVGWLSEEGMLAKALEIRGYKQLGKANRRGIFATGGVGALRRDWFELTWTNHLLFTVAELLKLGFEPGEFEYCPHCKRLQVDCDEEQRGIAAHNAEAAV